VPADLSLLIPTLRRRLALLSLAGSCVLLPAASEAQTESAAQRSARRPLPVMGQVQIGGVDPAHPYTSRSALATRSRPGRALASLDLPSLTNVPAAARNVLLAARGFVGTPYVWGGASPGGFDCSGFTRYVFGLVGVAIPRSSRAQLSAGDPVPTQVASLVPGDLLFFANAPSEPISHVAIYAGEGRMIHASGSGRAVRVDDLITSRGRWFATHMVAARRVLPTSPLPGASQ
jgi:cell wall-associated NlpC family hydrolase